MRYFKITVVVCLTLFLCYLAMIYNSAGLLFLGVGLPLLLVAELLFLWYLGRHLQIQVQMLSASANIGERVPMQMTVRNTANFPMLGIRLCTSFGEVPTLAVGANSQGSVMCEYKVEHCAKHLPQLNEVRLSDWLQFFSIRVKCETKPLVVWGYPNTINAQVPPLVWSASDGAEEAGEPRKGQRKDIVIGVREYQAGDKLHQIHWKMTARTGKLTVRETGDAYAVQAVLLLDLMALSRLPLEQRDQVYTELASMSLACLNRAITHAVVIPVLVPKTETNGDTADGISAENSGKTYTIQSTMITTQTQIYEMLRQCYHELSRIEQTQTLPPLWHARTTAAQHEKANQIKQQLMFEYNAQYDPVPMENVIYFPLG